MIIKRMKFNIMNILRRGKGETLMEAVVSILLFAILITTVTSMILISRRMTANTMVEARRIQEQIINDISLGNNVSLPGSTSGFEDTTVSFHSSIINTATNQITHQVRMFDDDGDPAIPANIIIFFPIYPGP